MPLFDVVGNADSVAPEQIGATAVKVGVTTALIVTDAVAVTAGQPPPAAIVYATVYVPAVLVLAVISPVDAFKVNPAGDALYVPPVYEPVPVNVTGCGVVTSPHTGLV